MDNKHVLLIEDDQNTSDIYSGILKTQGYQVDVALDGREGLDKASTNTYDLILLDIMMPKIDGLEALAVLKKYDAKRKVALFSNLSSTEIIEKAMKIGADEFIMKSDTDPDAFLVKVKKLTN